MVCKIEFRFRETSMAVRWTYIYDIPCAAIDWCVCTLCVLRICVAPEATLSFEFNYYWLNSLWCHWHFVELLSATDVCLPNRSLFNEWTAHKYARATSSWLREQPVQRKRETNSFPATIWLCVKLNDEKRKTEVECFLFSSPAATGATGGTINWNTLVQSIVWCSAWMNVFRSRRVLFIFFSFSRP